MRIVAGFATGLAAMIMAGSGQAVLAQTNGSADLQVMADISQDSDAVMPLFLEAYINNKPTNLVAEFALNTVTQEMSSPRSELIEIGLKPSAAQRGMVALKSFPGLSYVYDEAAQSIHITAPLAALKTDVVSAMPEAEQLDPERSYGAVLNYSLDGSFQKPGNSLAATLDGWLFSPMGTLRSSGFYRKSGQPGDAGAFVRLDTSYQFSSPKHRLTFTLGDVQSSTLSWARSIRLGGVQLRRDFGLRSDLVTQQLLSFDGAAAVPSTVDVFIDNNRAYSTGLEAGPYRLEDLPVRAGAGDALIVVTDANGRKTTKAVSFFVSQKLLKKGLADFSIEAGHARQSYGTSSNDYGSDSVFSASLRYGLTERITLEGHVEAKSDLRLFGLGLTTVPFNKAELSLAAGASDYANQTAAFAFGSLATRLGKIGINGSVQWSQAGYADLAYATGVDYLGAAAIGTSSSLLEAPRLQTALAINMPMGPSASVGIGYVQAKRETSSDKLLTASYSRQLDGHNGSVSFYGSHDLKTGDIRASVGLSLQIGKRKQMRANTSTDPSGGVSSGLYVSRAISDRQGDYGYSIEFSRSKTGQFAANAKGEYLGRYGKSAIEVSNAGGTATVRARLDGAIAFAGGAAAFGNQISDSFAIVDVGVPGVPVSVHNRQVATTGRGGKALVTGLSSNHRNRVSVDVDDLPAAAMMDATAMDVVPGLYSGVRVKLRSASGNNVVVVLQDANGKLLEAGASAYLNGSATESFVGFGGETYLEGLSANNTLHVVGDQFQCDASFAYQPTSGPVATIEGVTCR
jgi:outer membrane usher protein